MGITKRSGDVDMNNVSQTPIIVQPPLMDVLDNRAEEPMSLRSMLRFSRGNVRERAKIITCRF